MRILTHTKHTLLNVFWYFSFCLWLSGVNFFLTFQCLILCSRFCLYLWSIPIKGGQSHLKNHKRYAIFWVNSLTFWPFFHTSISSTWSILTYTWHLDEFQGTEACFDWRSVCCRCLKRWQLHSLLLRTAEKNPSRWSLLLIRLFIGVKDSGQIDALSPFCQSGSFTVPATWCFAVTHNNNKKCDFLLLLGCSHIDSMRHFRQEHATYFITRTAACCRWELSLTGQSRGQKEVERRRVRDGGLG